jgi:hypothetical protein
MYGITAKTEDVSGSNRIGPGWHIVKLKEITFGPVTDSNDTQVITFVYKDKAGNVHKDIRWPFNKESALKYYKPNEDSKYSDAELGIKKGTPLTEEQFINSSLKKIATEFKHILTKFVDPKQDTIIEIKEKDPDKAWAAFCGAVKKKIEKSEGWDEKMNWLVITLKKANDGNYYERTRAIVPFLKPVELGDTPESVEKYFRFNPKYDLFETALKSGANTQWGSNASNSQEEEDPNTKAMKARQEDDGGFDDESGW